MQCASTDGDVAATKRPRFLAALLPTIDAIGPWAGIAKCGEGAFIDASTCSEGEAMNWPLTPKRGTSEKAKKCPYQQSQAIFYR